MRYERHERLFIRRVRWAVVLPCALWVAVGLYAPAREAAHVVQPPQTPESLSPAMATLDPGSVSFGKQAVGSWGRAQRVVVTNTGGAPLHVNNVSLGGDDPAKFAIAAETCTGAEIAPFRACLIDIIFDPSGPKDFDAELKITNNASDSPQTLKLVGEGINSSMVPPTTGSR
ncbi:MAG: choice-of-anchor D domain-containing protein [Pyrinomonadaceae bacterium]